MEPGICCGAKESRQCRAVSGFSNGMFWTDVMMIESIASGSTISPPFAQLLPSSDVSTVTNARCCPIQSDGWICTASAVALNGASSANSKALFDGSCASTVSFSPAFVSTRSAPTSGIAITAMSP